MNPPLIQIGIAGEIMEGGDVATPPYEPSTEITYTCANNWKLVGTETNMCQASFEWTLMGANVPQCLQGNLRLIFFQTKLLK